MRWRRLWGSWWAVPLRGVVVRCWWNAELGKGANKLTAAPKPSGDQQWLPKAALAWARVDDRAAGRTRIEILADPPELLAWLRGNAGHGVDDCVPRTEGSLRRRSAQADRRRQGAASAEQCGEKIGLLSQGGEPSRLSRLAGTGQDERVDPPRAGDSGLGRSLRKRRRGPPHGRRADPPRGRGDRLYARQQSRLLPLSVHARPPPNHRQGP